jgi:hypothetical protein
MAEEVQKVERVLEVVVTKPLARLVYAGWLIGRYSVRAARYAWARLRERWTRAGQQA